MNAIVTSHQLLRTLCQEWFWEFHSQTTHSACPGFQQLVPPSYWKQTKKLFNQYYSEIDKTNFLMRCERQLFIFYSKTLNKIVVLETNLPTSLAYLMALSSMCWYCSIAAADRIKLGLVVASVGLYSFIAANI